MVRAADTGRSTPSQQVDPCSREGVALLRVEEEELLVAGDRPQRGRGGRLGGIAHLAHLLHDLEAGDARVPSPGVGSSSGNCCCQCSYLRRGHGQVTGKGGAGSAR